jgi:hypothetical protein
MIRDIEDAIDYLRRFHRSLHPDPRMDASRIPADLPRPLFRLYEELGELVEMDARVTRRRAPFAAQDGVLPLGRLKRTGGFIEFAGDNQGNWSARCAAGELDPAVYTDAGEDGSGSEEFSVVAQSVSDFLITLCLQEAALSAPFCFSINAPPAEALAAKCVPLWIDGATALTGFRQSFYEVPGEEVIVMNNGSTWVGSYSSSADGLIKLGVSRQRMHNEW